MANSIGVAIYRNRISFSSSWQYCSPVVLVVPSSVGYRGQFWDRNSVNLCARDGVIQFWRERGCGVECHAFHRSSTSIGRCDRPKCYEIRPKVAHSDGGDIHGEIEEMVSVDDDGFSVLNRNLTQGSGRMGDGSKKPAEGFSGVESGRGTQSMAEAFGISPRTAFAVTAGIAFAATVLPLFMTSTMSDMGLKTRLLSYATLLCGFYMAWNIGANDVANAMGTSVGSGALSLRQAVLTAAVLEFLGAFLVGSHVSHTMQKGILVVSVFEDKLSLLFMGLLSSLAAAGTWLQVASFYGWPVSTTHCIVGAMVGFGLVYGGLEAVYWKSLARVISSWIVSPMIGAVVSFLVYMCIRAFVYRAPNPGQAAAKAAPLAVFVGVAALSFTSLVGHGTLLVAIAQALVLGSIGALAMRLVIQRQLGSLLGAYCELRSEVKLDDKPTQKLSSMWKVDGPTGTQLKIVYSIFGYLQVLSACFMSFAHGANDVANAIGPISAALAILQGSGLHTQAGLPTEILAWGGFGIVAGLLVWGYRVIATIGKKITELTPTRGFAAEFAAATVVVVASRLGLPISATHTLVGAVMGVGFARGLNSVRGETVKEIVASWMVTIPVGAILSIIYTYVFITIVPSIL